MSDWPMEWVLVEDPETELHVVAIPPPAVVLDQHTNVCASCRADNDFSSVFDRTHHEVGHVTEECGRRWPMPLLLLVGPHLCCRCKKCGYEWSQELPPTRRVMLERARGQMAEFEQMVVEEVERRMEQLESEREQERIEAEDDAPYRFEPETPKPKKAKDGNVLHLVPTFRHGPEEDDPAG